jgi:DNA-binding MarR family transcriptional regulator
MTNKRNNLRRLHSLAPTRAFRKYQARKEQGKWRKTPLKKEEIDEIRRLWSESRANTQTVLANRYRVSQSTISRIIREVFQGKAA